MTNALGDILANKWEEPPEIKAIKDFVQKKFNGSVAVSISQSGLIIACDSSALAATLRMHIIDLQKASGTDKKLIIRIS